MRGILPVETENPPPDSQSRWSVPLQIIFNKSAAASSLKPLFIIQSWHRHSCLWKQRICCRIRKVDGASCSKLFSINPLLHRREEAKNQVRVRLSTGRNAYATLRLPLSSPEPVRDTEPVLPN